VNISRARAGFVLLVSLLLPTPGGAGTPAGDSPVALPLSGPTWHPVNVWRQTEGLPQNTIITIQQTEDGYLWVGTKGGLARFDGVRFTTFKEAALSETEVWDLSEGADHSLWVGTYGGGLLRVKNGRLVESYKTNEGLLSDFVSSVCASSDAVWAGTDRGLARMDLATHEIRSYTKKDGLVSNVVSGLLCGDDGTVWIGTAAGGLHRVEKGRVKEGGVGPNLLEGQNADSVNLISSAPDGSLWLGTLDAVFHLKDGALRRFTEADGLPDTRGMRVHVDHAGNVWVGTLNGLFGYQDGRFVKHDILTDVTQKQAVRALTSDHEGSLWIGHAVLGLARLRKGYFASYTTSHGLAGSSVRNVAEDGEGNIWLGTSEGLNRVRDGRVQLIVARDGTEMKPISSIAQDPAGRMWVGTPDGVLRFQPKPGCATARCVEDVKVMDNGGIARMIVRIIYADRAGDVWVGTDLQGLARYHGDRVTVYTTKDGLTDDGIRGLAEDAQGRLWIGTKERGVCVFENGRFRAITDKDGLAHNMVQSIYAGPDGSMWVATRHGLTRIKDGRFVTYRASMGLNADHVYGMVADSHGDLWMGCSRGVFRVRQAELDAFAEGRTQTIVSDSFGVEHGMRSTEAAVGYFPTIARGRDGRLWFATTDGVSVVAPIQLEKNALAPPVHVDEVSINGVEYDLTQAAEAPPGSGDLVFRYAGLSFAEPSRVRFKVRLDPYDRDWIDVGNLRLKQYTNIPPGRYHFRVIAANSDGIWNETGATFELRLLPHFHQTIWFYALVAAAAAAAIFGVHRWRVRRFEQNERELQARVEQATAHIKTLRGLLPICASCKKIRDDSGYWNQMETYISDHSGADFSHSICPECLVQLYPDYAAQTIAKGS